MPRKKKTTKKCSKCGKRQKIDQFGKHAKTEDGYRNSCRSCTKPRQAPTAAPDAQVNGLLVSVTAVVDSALMPVVSALVRAMRKSGTTKLTIDLNAGYIEIPTPERFALPKEAK